MNVLGTELQIFSGCGPRRAGSENLALPSSTGSACELTFLFFQLHDERVVTFRIVVCTMNSTVSFRMPSSQKRRMRWSLRRWPGLVSALRASSMPNEPESPTFPEKWLSEEHLDALVVLES